MQQNRHNISAAYNLAGSMQAAIKGHFGEVYLVDFLDAEKDSFWRRLHNPEKVSTLHIFLRNWEESCWDQSFRHMNLIENFGIVSDYLNVCAIALPTWFTPAAARKRPRSVWALLQQAFPNAANAAFQVLFQDREFLLRYQDLVLDAINKKRPTAKSSLATQKIVRPHHLPAWLRMGVYHRDRGRCQACGMDISGTLNLENVLHFDHILPLHAGGTNDAPNFQLLCKDCNSHKSGNRQAVNNINHSYW